MTQERPEASKRPATRSAPAAPCAASPCATANLHTPQEFSVAYGDRKAAFYAGLLAYVIRVGTPGPMLDLGTGLAFLPELAAQWGIRAIGVEGSSYAVETARSRAPGLELICLDLGEQLPIESGTMANVVLHQVIEHLDQARLDLVWKECFRVMRAGATMFVYSPSRRNLREKGERTHINMLLPSELKQQLLGAGFSVVREPNEGLWWTGHQGAVLDRLASLALRVLPHDWTSATANAIAIKPRA